MPTSSSRRAGGTTSHRPGAICPGASLRIAGRADPAGEREIGSPRFSSIARAIRSIATRRPAGGAHGLESSALAAQWAVADSSSGWSPRSFRTASAEGWVSDITSWGATAPSNQSRPGGGSAPWRRRVSRRPSGSATRPGGQNLQDARRDALDRPAAGGHRTLKLQGAQIDEQISALKRHLPTTSWRSRPRASRTKRSTSGWPA